MNFIVLYRYLLSERIKCSIWYRNSFSECDSTATKSPPLNRLQKNWKRKKILKDKQINKFNTTNTSFICICAVDSLTYSYVMKSFNRVYKVTVFAICQCLWPTIGFEDFPLKLGAKRTTCWAIRQNYLFLLQDDNSDQWNKFLPSITS